MSANLDQLQPDLQPFARELIRVAGSAGLQPRVTSTRRSHAEQERLYRRALAGQQPYPVAPPGTSAHEYGWAFDMVVSPMSALPEVGAYWEQMGGVWGARAGAGYDPVHFEYPGWRSTVDFSQPDERGQLDRPLLYQAVKYADPTFGVGTTLLEEFANAPSRLADVVTGRRSIYEEYAEFFESILHPFR